MSNPRLATIVAAILAAAACRIAPHPWNVTPVAAMALFAGAYLPSRLGSLLIPLAALLLSDLVLGLYGHMEFVYGSFALIVCLGWLLRARRSPLRIGAVALTGSVLFFLFTNFGVWVSGSFYPRTAQGLLACYTAAIPFFRNTLVGDAFYTLVLFGGFALGERAIPALRQDPMLQPA